MVGQVVPHERVEKVGVVAEVCRRDGDQLAIAGRLSVLRGAHQVAGLVSDECGSHQHHRGPRAGCALHDPRACGRVATDHAAKQRFDVIGHASKVDGVADDSLTPI
jgi:hypothetical protein